MHAFTELAHRCTTFTQASLEAAADDCLTQLESSGATRHVKALQMIGLQKAIMAVGMFSMFEAALQDGLSCADGFAEAKRILNQEGESALNEHFSNLGLAINVLKHGQGRSYELLVQKSAGLPFKVRPPDESFFCDGDVAEVDTLILVDDDFVLTCAKVIEDVSGVINTVRPEFRG